MNRLLRPRQWAYVLVAALLLAVAAGGVGYAAGSPSKNVSACVNSKNRLALQNAKGKCPKKYKKVSIAKQGPRGATGPRGGTGSPGPQGPGATALLQDFTAPGSGTPRVVGGLAYTPSCSSGNGTVALVAVTAVSGATVYVRGIRAVAGSVPETVVAGATTPVTVVFAKGVGTTSTAVVAGALVYSGATVQTVSLSVTAIDVAGPDGVRCSIEGTITPAA